MKFPFTFLNLVVRHDDLYSDECNIIRQYRNEGIILYQLPVLQETLIFLEADQQCQVVITKT